MAIDNGLKYNFMIYVETTSKDEMKKLIDYLNKALDALTKLVPQNLANYLAERRILDWGEETYLLLSKEFVVVKYVIK